MVAPKTSSNRKTTSNGYATYNGIRITRLLQPGDSNTKLRKNGPEFLTAGLSLSPERHQVLATRVRMPRLVAPQRVSIIRALRLSLSEYETHELPRLNSSMMPAPTSLNCSIPRSTDSGAKRREKTNDSP